LSVARRRRAVNALNPGRAPRTSEETRGTPATKHYPTGVSTRRHGVRRRSRL